MGERDFAMIEHDYRNVFKRYKSGFYLLDGKRIMIPPEFCNEYA